MLDAFMSLLPTENALAMIAIVIIGIMVVIFVMRALFKLALMIGLIGVIAVVFLGYTPEEVFDKGKDAYQTATSMYEKTVRPIMDKELKDAEYEFNKDGTFVIKTTSLKITGKTGDSKALVSYKGNEFEINIGELSETIQKKMNEMNNQKQ